MSKTFMIVPIRPGVGLTTTALGLVRAMEEQGLAVGYYKPITTRTNVEHDVEQTTRMLRQSSDINPPTPITIKRVEQLLSKGESDELLEEIVGIYSSCAKSADVVLVQGLVSTQDYPYAGRLNVQIAKALDAKVMLVASPSGQSSVKLAHQIEIASEPFGGVAHPRTLGVIINKANGPVDDKGNTRLDLAQSQPEIEIDQCKSIAQESNLFNQNFKLLGCVPWDIQLISPRVIDIQEYLSASVIHEGESKTRRISHITLCARGVEHMIGALKPGTLIITASDRVDIIIAAAMAALNGTQIAAVLLTGDYPLPDDVLKLARQAMDSGLPILQVSTDSFRTALALQNLNIQVPVDDIERIEFVKNHTSEHLDKAWIESISNEKAPTQRRMSPPAFRYQLIEKARAARKRVVLPEGSEPRTVAAAIICANKEIAHCILLAKPEEVKNVAENQGLTIPSHHFEIIDPEPLVERYVAPMVELRKHKGLTDLLAREQLQDTVVLGTMMLKMGDVDGLVSGAIHTTANTIRPALQLIKTAPHAKLVSSIFFMCMPDQVLIYGDCAVNPEPTSEELCDIAIQSADSASAFSISPRVAMISYSTGSSGRGEEVEKVRRATALVQAERLDILIDGPLQYDAAQNEQVAKSKAPNSPVAGQATVFIFPDLNTGNTTYKAVQRSANVLCIGPMLQGLAKPVNDLSRGALIDDIVYTIAITAIQAVRKEGKS